MDVTLTIGERLGDLICGEEGLTANELASRTGVSASLISDLRRGKDREVSYKTVISLARYFGVSTDYLLGLSEMPTIQENEKISVKTTGLNSKSVKKLNEWKQQKKQQKRLPGLIWADYIDILNRLVTTSEGNRLLSKLIEYLDCDFSEFYTEDDQMEIISYCHPIVYKHIDGTHSYVYPEAFEQIALNEVTNAVKKMRESQHGKGNDK